MTIQQLRRKFALLELTPHQYAEWEQGRHAAETGQTPQPHWTRWQRAGYTLWRQMQAALRSEGMVEHA